MKLPPLPATPHIPAELRNCEFLRTLAGNRDGRKEIERIRDQLVSMRSALLSQSAACDEVIANLTRALSAVAGSGAERAH